MQLSIRSTAIAIAIYGNLLLVIEKRFFTVGYILFYSNLIKCEYI